jgi:hypothetical protein
VGSGRLTETHEYFHRQLDDTTAFGGLLSTAAALADALPDSRFPAVLDRLLAMCDLVHEAFAVGMSLIATQRPIAPVDNYPTYDRHVRVVQRLVGPGVHPWVALAAVRAAATGCMQSSAIALAVEVGVDGLDPLSLPKPERPNHRLSALLNGGFSASVTREQLLAQSNYGDQEWWCPVGDVTLPPDAMDGELAVASGRVHQSLLADAFDIIGAAGGTSVQPDAHHDQLRVLLTEARSLAPAGLTRIGALVEAPGGELMHGGPLDGQTIELTSAPARATVLPYGSLSGISSEGPDRHSFMVFTTPRRLHTAFELQGVPLPTDDALMCVRTTVFADDRADSVLLLVADEPEQVEDSELVYVSLFSSAVAAAPEVAASWMQWADPFRLSLVMDTPATAALRRWCASGARFHTETQAVRIGGDELRIIAGRVSQPGGQSPLVIIPSTEFGARWFEAARAEDEFLRSVVVEDDELFGRESAHLDVLLRHLLMEERFVGTGSWRR